MPEPATKDPWDKAEIILKPVGGIVTALAVAGLGFFGSQFLERRQEADAKVRLYAELMSSREQSDSSLRRQMFDSIITTFLKPDSDNVDEKVLSLELLAYNFHDAIDLGPLFKHVETRIELEPENTRERLRGRLERVAKEVNAKQIASLEEVADIKSVDVEIAGDVPFEGVSVLRNEPLVLPDDQYGPNRRVFFDVLSREPGRKELTVRMEIWTEGEDHAAATDRFSVGFFDFPMIDNTRLSDGQRLAVVLTNWQEFDANFEVAKLALVLFPGSRASLKEKPYYDEVVSQLVPTREP